MLEKVSLDKNCAKQLLEPKLAVCVSIKESYPFVSVIPLTLG